MEGCFALQWWGGVVFQMGASFLSGGGGGAVCPMGGTSIFDWGGGGGFESVAVYIQQQIDYLKELWKVCLSGISTHDH